MVNRLRFQCNNCSEYFETDLDSLSMGVLLHTCERCQSLCYLLKVPEETSSFDALEMHGCQIVDHAPPEISGIRPIVSGEDPVGDREMLQWIQEEAESREEEVMAGWLSEWRVERSDGQSFVFHFLAALRKWVMDGRVGIGDHIVTRQGARYALETYPGCADLFENIEVARARRAKVLDEKRRRLSRLSRWRRIKSRRLEVALALLALIPIAVVVFQAYQRYEANRTSRMRAAAYIDGLVNVRGLDGEAGKSIPRLVPGVFTGAIWSSDHKRLQQSIAQAAQAVRGPQDWQTICHLTEALVRRGTTSKEVRDLALAEDLLNHLKAQRPSPPCALRAEAVYLWSQGQELSAEKTIRRFLEIEERDPYAYYLLALIAADVGKDRERGVNLKQALSRDPHNTIFLLELAGILEKQERWQEGLAVLEPAMEANPFDVGLVRKAAHFFAQSGDFRSAETLVQRALAQQGQNHETFHFLLVSLYHQQKRFEEARKAAAVYLKRHPDGQHLAAVRTMDRRARVALQEQRRSAREAEALRSSEASRSRRRIWSRH